jgi:hypothetical protein
MQQDITNASDEAARKYFDETPEEERFDYGITAVMRAVAKSKTTSLRRQFGKHLVIANPKLGDKFLDEVNCQPSLIFIELLNHFILFLYSFILAL